MTDRELDRLVAEKVMQGAKLPVIWEPTKNPSDFMQVVERMREKGYECSITTEPPGWSADFISPSLDLEGGASDNSLGRAIALAALEAVK